MKQVFLNFLGLQRQVGPKKCESWLNLQNYAKNEFSTPNYIILDTQHMGVVWIWYFLSF